MPENNNKDVIDTLLSPEEGKESSENKSNTGTKKLVKNGKGKLKAHAKIVAGKAMKTVGKAMQKLAKPLKKIADALKRAAKAMLRVANNIVRAAASTGPAAIVAVPAALVVAAPIYAAAAVTMAASLALQVTAAALEKAGAALERAGTNMVTRGQQELQNVNTNAKEGNTLSKVNENTGADANTNTNTDTNTDTNEKGKDGDKKNILGQLIDAAVTVYMMTMAYKNGKQSAQLEQQQKAQQQNAANPQPSAAQVQHEALPQQTMAQRMKSDATRMQHPQTPPAEAAVEDNLSMTAIPENNMSPSPQNVAAIMRRDAVNARKYQEQMFGTPQNRVLENQDIVQTQPQDMQISPTMPGLNDRSYG